MEKKNLQLQVAKAVWSFIRPLVWTRNLNSAHDSDENMCFPRSYRYHCLTHEGLKERRGYGSSWSAFGCDPDCNSSSILAQWIFLGSILHSGRCSLCCYSNSIEIMGDGIDLWREEQYPIYKMRILTPALFSLFEFHWIGFDGGVNSVFKLWKLAFLIKKGKKKYWKKLFGIFLLLRGHGSRKPWVAGVVITTYGTFFAFTALHFFVWGLPPVSCCMPKGSLFWMAFLDLLFNPFLKTSIWSSHIKPIFIPFSKTNPCILQTSICYPEYDLKAFSTN